MELQIVLVAFFSAIFLKIVFKLKFCCPIALNTYSESPKIKCIFTNDKLKNLVVLNENFFKVQSGHGIRIM